MTKQASGTALRLTVIKGQENLGGEPAEMIVGRSHPFVVGRSDACDWALSDPTRHVSWQHFEVAWSDSAFRIRDLSTNGTFLDGAAQRIDGLTVIGNGTRISFGGFVINVDVVIGETTGVATTPASAPATPPPPAKPIRRSSDPAAAVAQLELPAPVVEDLTRIHLAPRKTPSPTPPVPPLATPAKNPSAASALEAAPIAISAETPPPMSSGAPDVLLSVPTPAAVPPPPTVSLPGSADASNARFDADLRARIVVGLGVPVEALAGVETGELIERLGQLVRLAADDLHRRFNEKLAVSRRLRPRARPGRRFRDHNPFRAGDTGASLAMMLVADPNGPQAAVKVFERSRAELADFRNRLDRSVDRAVAQLGAELAPAAIEAHCQAAGATPSLGDAAWELYRLAWDDLDPDWQQGFRAAFDQFVAQALDDEQ